MHMKSNLKKRRKFSDLKVLKSRRRFVRKNSRGTGKNRRGKWVQYHKDTFYPYMKLSKTKQKSFVIGERRHT